MSVRTSGRPAASASLSELRAQLPAVQKSPSGAPAYMRFVNRYLGGWLAVLAFRLGLSPTQVTLLSAALSFLSILAVAVLQPTPARAAAIAVGLLLGFALDSADGQLARLLGGGTAAGEWLDHVVDCFRSCTLHAAVAVSLYRFAPLPHPVVLLLPLAYTAVGLTLYFAMMLRDQLRRSAGIPPLPPGPASTTRSVLMLPVDYGVLCLAFVLLSEPALFLLAYGALFALNTLFSVHSLRKAYRSLAAQDQRVAQG